ncbi:MAG: hypothetical protein ALECFALPRED_000982 [Alectoria fallacina]|uniref:Rhodopsin domain-containing protein n=1 Tax=Alectoria fallacina TaxID=1903189 RepID=A0A8H3I8T3_9LECA|nr:MAG: hypothetical protein ALECFALPRED_000982 [Alectoria fallacina]
MSALSSQEIEYELAHASDNRGPTLIAAYAVCLSLAYVAVTLRFISRRKSRNALMADDWMSVVGLLFTSGQVAVGVYGTASLRALLFLAAKDKRTKHLSPSKRGTSWSRETYHLLKGPGDGFILIEVFYTAAAAAIKFSTLLLYRRIFDSNKRLMIACWVVAAVVASYSIAQIVMSIFQCAPVHKAWNPATPGTCLNTFVAATSPAAVNVVADFATVFLPMPLIWGMHMQWKRKVQLLGIFMLGGFVIFASIWRAATMKDLSHLDASWTNVDPCIWSIVENGIGIVSTCLPTLRPLYSLAVRGHYCRSNEYCTRCQETSRGSKTRLNAWKFWKSSSFGSRQGSDRSSLPGSMPGSMSSTGEKADVESQWPVTGKERQQTQLFSIMDGP